MQWLPSRYSLDDNRARAAEVVLVVDVDGVLNVGARDDSDGDAPLLVNQIGLEGAAKLWPRRKTHSMGNTIDRLVSISKRECEEGATYSKFACKGDAQVSDVLISRLAKLIQATGERRIVVLSSKWQQHKNHIKRLEKHISEHLGSAFSFEAKTGMELECTAECRLQTVGSFLEGLCSFRGSDAGPMRVLVLEDFHITPMDGWSCRGTKINSVSDAEQHLRKRMGATDSVTVKLIHTYDEFKSEDGLTVQLGSGLNITQFAEAEAFLQGTGASSQQPEPANKQSTSTDADDSSNGKRKETDAPDSSDLGETPPSKALKLFKPPELKEHNSE